ncbi:hypothetical protein E4U42_008102 [Claviceps africana]|uniref:Uncharacterized protein n=1 Tax=Claviceps africana TaxID=83212 RepID=A0A8K0J5X6_9HYPO|nr:hypothetical protein E4U42_008102 [Claviceps africana]
MSPGPKSYSRVAHVEDADEDSGSSINGKPGTRKYATSGPSSNPSKANTSKSRSDKRPIASRSSSAAAALNESDSRRAAEQKARTARQHSSGKDGGDPELRAKDRERRDRKLREEEKDREQQRKDRAPLREDEKDRKAKAKAAPTAAKDESRPPRTRRPTTLNQSATQPAPNYTYKRGHVDSPASYGLQQPAMSGTRPRAQPRTASYHAGQPYGPPPGSMGMMWPPPHQSAAPFPIGTFPPPIWQDYGTSPGGFAAPPPPSPLGPAPAYYDGPAAQDPHFHLRQRFGTRDGSVMGYQKPPLPLPPPPSTMEYYDSRDYFDDPPLRCPVARRPSRFQRAEDDRRKMPPPDFVPTRPQSAIPPSTSFRPPALQQRPASRQSQSQSRPPVTRRRTVNFADQQPQSDDDGSSGEQELFHDVSPGESFEDRHAVVPRAPRGSTAYDHRNYDIVPASTRPRRSSTYGSSSLASDGVSLDEKKYNEALRYQEKISGNPQMPLTAEYLKKAGRSGGVASSRSTRSSGSPDDSDYKRSNATGITHTSSNTEDWNIKISGNACLRFPGAEIQCGDNAEIVFTAPGGGGGPRLGSDKASMIHPQLEDWRSRSEHKALPHRPRAPSQSDSQSRSYAPSHASYAPSGASF